MKLKRRVSYLSQRLPKVSFNNPEPKQAAEAKVGSGGGQPRGPDVPERQKVLAKEKTAMLAREHYLKVHLNIPKSLTFINTSPRHLSNNP